MAMQDSFIQPKIQVYRGERMSGMVDEAMLTNALRMQPQELPQVISYIYGTKYAGYSTAIDLLTGGLGHKITLERPSYEWNIRVADERPVRIRYAEDQTGSRISPLAWNVGQPSGKWTSNDDWQIGVGLAPFTIVLEEPLFGPGSIIELDDKSYQLRVMAEPEAEATKGYRYRVQIANGDPDATVDPHYLVEGCAVSRVGSAYEEGSDQADIINYSTGLRLRNYLSTVRLKIDITGSARADVLAYAMQDPTSGKSTMIWADYQMWEATRQFMERMEYQMMFDQTTADSDGTFKLKGANGRVIKRGSGIEEQIAPACRSQYTRLSCDQLEDFLFDLSYNVMDTKDRKFVLLTGEMGMREFDRALRDKIKDLKLYLADTKFISGDGQNMAVGGAFTTYRMRSGIEVTCKVLPFLDDPNHNRLLHPISKKPKSSYDMYFLDNGFRNGRANIQKIVKKNREMVQWVVAGSCSPEGFAGSTRDLRANSIDGYSVHFLSEMGVVILDPRGCGKLECAIEG